MLVELITSLSRYNVADTTLNEIPYFAGMLNKESLFYTGSTIDLRVIEDKFSPSTIDSYLRIITDNPYSVHNLVDLLTLNNFLGESGLFNDVFYSNRLHIDMSTLRESNSLGLIYGLPVESIIVDDISNKNDFLEVVRILIDNLNIEALYVADEDETIRRLLPYGDGHHSILSLFEDSFDHRVLFRSGTVLMTIAALMASSRYPTLSGNMWGAVLSADPDAIPIWRLLDEPDRYRMERYKWYLSRLPTQEQFDILSSYIEGKTLDEVLNEYDRIMHAAAY